jgi:phosphoribosylformylglycinamidine cyclo-ligase
MLNTFNCGIGMIVAVDPAQVDRILSVISEADHEAQVIGRVVPREDGPAVRYQGGLEL